jgi:hypothetical protein
MADSARPARLGILLLQRGVLTQETMMHRTFLAALGAAALALAGCGGDDTKQATRPVQFSKPPSGPLTKAQYIAAADVICREAAQAGKTYRERLQAMDRTDGPDAVPLIHGAVRQARDGFARLRALRRPEHDDNRLMLKGYLGARKLAIENGERFEAATRSGDDGERRMMLSGDGQVLSFQAGFAKKYGFKVCGRDPSVVNPSELYGGALIK